MLWIGLLVCLAGAIFVLFATRSAPTYSNIADDETIVFFRTTGWLNQETQEWHLPIHGWVYQPQDSRARRALFERILKNRYDLSVDADTEANFGRRLNLIIADNERGKRIVISIAGRTEVLPTSTPNGHFSTTLTMSAADMRIFGANKTVPFIAITSDKDGREFSGEVRLVSPKGLSVISDIDDTVKVSNVTDRRQLLEKTFLQDFEDVPGMAETYARWASCGATIHFVSSSPWQLYKPLTEFLDAAGFPWAPLNLKLVRFRDKTLFDLFKEGSETKPPVIRAILDRYPDRQFVLVGDSGEQDPEIYAAFLRERPEQIQRVYIRHVTGDARDAARLAAVFDGINPETWHLFQSPEDLALPETCP